MILITITKLNKDENWIEWNKFRKNWKPN